MMIKWKKPKFSLQEKMLDAALHDTESFQAIQFCVDAIMIDRDKYSNKFIPMVQIYASLLKSTYIYENILRRMLKLKKEEFEYLDKEVKNIAFLNVKGIDFDRISKKIDKEPMIEPEKTESKNENKNSYIT